MMRKSSDTFEAEANPRRSHAAAESQQVLLNRRRSDGSEAFTEQRKMDTHMINT